MTNEWMSEALAEGTDFLPVLRTMRSQVPPVAPSLESEGDGVEQLLDCLGESEFMFCLDDLNHLFELELISAWHRGLDYGKDRP